MDPFQDDSQSAGAGFDPMSLLRIFWRRKMLFFIPFILCSAMAVVFIRTMTPIYESSGQLLINVDRMNSRLLEDPSRRFGRSREVDGIAYHEMQMVLTSPEFLKKVVVELGLHSALRESLEDSVAATLTDDRLIRGAVKRLRSMVKMKPDGARLFQIAVRDPDPEQAYNLAYFLVDRLVEEYRNSQLVATTSARTFMEGQLEIYLKELEKAEKDLLEYQTSQVSAGLIDNPINASQHGAI